jgi:3,8-divinyl chlorophyllide a/chlorophyllide a reductase subunit Y
MSLTVPEGNLITPDIIPVQKSSNAPAEATGHSVDPEHNLTPQSMCPAFGSLRVLTRIDGLQTAMVTDTGCLYGLTFVSHFYAARKSISAPEFGTKELVAGNVAEAALASCIEASKMPGTKLIAAISLCVAETAGLTEEMLPAQVNGIDTILVRVPAYAIHSHPEAKDVAINAVLKKFAAPREMTDVGVEMPLTFDGSNSDEEALRKKVILLGEVFPADPLTLDAVLKKMGSGVACNLPSRNLDDYRNAAKVGAIAALHPFYNASVATLRSAGVPIISGAPVGPEAVFGWIKGIGAALKLDPALVEQVAAEEHAKCCAVLQNVNLNGAKIHVCGYEGNELLYARLLVEAGATVPYISTSIGKSLYTAADEAWLKARGTREIVWRKTLEQDVRALDAYKPDLVLGTTSLASAAKQRGIPAMYYTNTLSVRPLMLAAGLAGTMQLIKGALDNRPRYQWMREFFTGETSTAASADAVVNTMD